jgi:calcineurin-like phosphoesterase family protein
MTNPPPDAPFRRLTDLKGVRRSSLHSRYRRKLEDLDVPPNARFPRKLEALMAGNVGAWLASYLKYAFRKKHPFPDYSGSGDRGVYPLAADGATGGAVRVGIAGDWASGTKESFRVAAHIEAFRPHYTIHLGDVYYVGDPDEVRENVLGEPAPGVMPVTWPLGTRGSFALNGNHEMYANGDAYFDLLLPRLGIRSRPGGTAQPQRASFFGLRNDHWLLVGLDTGYNSVGWPVLSRIPLVNSIPAVGGDCKLPAALVAWLRAEIAPETRGRGVVLLSHHQYYSAFESEYAVVGRQLAEFVDRPVLWFWGHEHRLAVYGAYGVKGGVRAYGRCLGNGGMPVSLEQPKHDRADRGLVWHDGRENPAFPDDEIGYNGYATMVFDGPTLAVEYRDLEGTLLARERWKTTDGDVALAEFRAESRSPS